MDEGDAAGHAFIAAELTAARPDDALLSEEGADDPRRHTHDRVWIVDPLDGTREYGDPQRNDWAVHVALWERGALTAGAVALPAMELTLATDPPPAVPESHRTRPVVVTSRSRPSFVTAIAAEAIDADIVPIGSAGAKAMAVVTGIADVYVHAGGMYQWDSAAPAAVAMAAGLHVSRIDGSPDRLQRAGPVAARLPRVPRAVRRPRAGGDRQGVAGVAAPASLTSGCRSVKRCAS